MVTKLRVFFLALCALALFAAGCGDDEDSGDGDGSAGFPTQTLSVTATGPNEFTAPETAETGLTSIVMEKNS